MCQVRIVRVRFGAIGMLQRPTNLIQSYRALTHANSGVMRQGELERARHEVRVLPRRGRRGGLFFGVEVDLELFQGLIV